MNASDFVHELRKLALENANLKDELRRVRMSAESLAAHVIARNADTIMERVWGGRGDERVLDWVKNMYTIKDFWIPILVEHGISGLDEAERLMVGQRANVLHRNAKGKLWDHME